jgi:hypothetical protein
MPELRVDVEISEGCQGVSDNEASLRSIATLPPLFQFCFEIATFQNKIGREEGTPILLARPTPDLAC